MLRGYSLLSGQPVIHLLLLLLELGLLLLQLRGYTHSVLHNTELGSHQLDQQLCEAARLLTCGNHVKSKLIRMHILLRMPMHGDES